MKSDQEKKNPNRDEAPKQAEDANEQAPAQEIGGPSGPEPTRYGDWERKGRCVDF